MTLVKWVAVDNDDDIVITMNRKTELRLMQLLIWAVKSWDNKYVAELDDLLRLLMAGGAHSVAAQDTEPPWLAENPGGIGI
jgi:hypothetical protein